MQHFNKLTPTILKKLKEIVGQDYIFYNQEKLEKYSRDETEDLSFLPEVVVLPRTTTEISQILKCCNKYLIPITPRGAGTGLAGGALPVLGGVVLSLERLNSILNIDTQNLQVTVEAGVITEVLQEAVKAKGLFYPPDPSSKGSCFIGGNINTNAGGPKAVKYGVVKDYVLNLEVVLPSGEIIWTGANTLKNSTGYNLTQLLIGSEGTLGIVTKAVLRLLPYPKENLTLLIPFNHPTKACEAVSAIFRAGIIPSCLEFMERAAIEYAIRYLGTVSFEILEDVKAHLLIEVDGQDLEVLYKDCEKITTVVEEFGAGDILFADTESAKNELWKLRRCVGRATKSSTIYKEEDTVVPRAYLPQLLEGVKRIGEQYGFESVCYGHAGDGNLHVNILKGNLSDEFWNNELNQGIREIFELVKTLGGTISGEHGIGWVQKEFMDIMFSEVELNLMRNIKKVFDKNGILNPSKIF